ncbi:helix-turn-helix domain-containing protein [Parabacteroides distasonis]|nr:helix-turn-helix domain-containing protein [Parabacteroides distasonis]
MTGYSVNYLYHLASSGAIPCVKRGRSLRFDVDELQRWMQQQYVPASNKLSDEREKG